MRKSLFLSIIVLLMFGCGPKAGADASASDSAESQVEAQEGDNTESHEAEAENEATPGAWSESFTGDLDGKIALTLDLNGLEEVVRGTLVYKSAGKPITVLGSLSAEGTFFLREYQPDGLVSGVMSGTYKDGTMKGTWFSSGKDRALSLKATGARNNAVKWPYEVVGSVAGGYGYHYPKEEGMDGASGSMDIQQAENNVTFDFECVNGPPGYNMAFVDETKAVLEGNTITYKMPDLDCKFSIRFFKGFAVVEHEDEMYECEFGNGAGIEGQYMKLR